MQDPAVQRLFEFLKFRSISADPACAPAVRECAAWLHEQLEGMGLHSKVHQTDGHPIVVARTPHDPSLKTVLIYGHYDVQPVDPLELWDSDPFEPVIRGGLIHARGATDNKGQIWSHIEGLRSLLESGRPPVNVVFVIEGEEEVGSQSLERFLRENAGELACDVAMISDNAMLGRGVPTLTYGLRGIAALEVIVTGPAQDLHSGAFGGAISNPATVLARLIASLHDETGHIAVDGFYDAVRPLEKWERTMWNSLPVSADTLLTVAGSPAWGNEEGFTPFECIWGRPTAEVNGIGGGYQGPGSKTVLPSRAMAKLTFRLVPDQEPEVIAQLVERHFRARLPASVRMEVLSGHGAMPYVVDPHGPFGKAGQRALRRAMGPDPVLVREGGTIPILQVFKDTLAVDVLLLGLALPDCNMHAPNETFPLEHLQLGIDLHRAALEEIAGATGET